MAKAKKVTKKKKPDKKIDLKSLEQEYRSLMPEAQSLADELTHQIGEMITDAGISLGFPIQRRVKKWSSLSKKIEGTPSDINTVKEIQDLAGLRIILLFQRDVERVCSLISDNLTVIHQYDTQERLKEDQFGYSSTHFVVKLPPSWLAVPTFAKLKNDLITEIQVRTLTQHIWAEASHTLQYKKEESVPPSVLRPLYRVSALLETVDLEFNRVLEQRDTYRKAVDVSGTEDVLNVDLLEKTLDSLLPERNQVAEEDYAGLLPDITHFGIKTQQELRDLLDKHLQAVLEEDARVAKDYLALLLAGEDSYAGDRSRLEQGFFFAHVGLVRQALIFEFGKDVYSTYMKEIRKRDKSE